MLNLDALKEIAGHDPEILRDLLSQFVETTREDVRNLQDAVAAGCARDVAGLAHRIKGSCFVVGADQLADLADTLEQDSREDQRCRFAELSTKMVTEFQRVLEVIENL